MAITESTAGEVYVPLPDTIQARALDALAGSPNGSMAASVLADSLGQFVVAPDLGDMLAPCVLHGLIVSDRRSGLTFYDITADGLASLKRIKSGDIPPPRTPRPGPAPATKARKPIAFSAPTDEPPGIDEPLIECALTSSGRLVIDANGMQMTLAPEQVRALFEYTDRVRAGKGR